MMAEWVGPSLGVLDRELDKLAAGLGERKRRLGPARAGKLYDWLLEADLDLKGSGPHRRNWC